MILTEEEAKTKACQESFPAAEGLSLGGYAESVPIPPNAISFNTSGSYARQTAPSMCIGSGCMAWRWLDPTSFKGVPREPDSLGYCGKAGAP